MGVPLCLISAEKVLTRMEEQQRQRSVLSRSSPRKLTFFPPSTLSMSPVLQTVILIASNCE